MYITLNRKKIRCSQCQSTHCEYVTFANYRFKRCRTCGHESEYHPILPKESGQESPQYRLVLEEDDSSETF